MKKYSYAISGLALTLVLYFMLFIYAPLQEDDLILEDIKGSATSLQDEGINLLFYQAEAEPLPFGSYEYQAYFENGQTTRGRVNSHIDDLRFSFPLANRPLQDSHSLLIQVKDQLYIDIDQSMGFDSYQQLD